MQLAPCAGSMHVEESTAQDSYRIDRWQLRYVVSKTTLATKTTGKRRYTVNQWDAWTIWTTFTNPIQISI